MYNTKSIYEKVRKICSIWNDDNPSSDSVESDLSIYNKVTSGKNVLVKVLKEYCVRNKLPATGKKADLIATIAASSPP